MAEEKPNQEQAQESGHGIDLTSLSKLALGPVWSSGPTPKTAARPQRFDDSDAGDHPRRDSGARRDRRGPRPQRKEFGSGGGQPAGEEQGGRRPRRERDDRGPRRERPPRPFEPTVDVTIYPEEAPFKALTSAVKASGRTFELFEIARLILEKPERLVVVVRPLKGAPVQHLYVSAPDNLPFETEQEAVDHVFSQHLDKFFEVQEVEVDPPKGAFSVINRCGMTGELLGPPNYHKYQQILQQHHSKNLSHVPFERFQQRIEGVRDPEVVNAWLEKMRKQIRLRLKEPREGMSSEFDNVDSARFHLLLHAKELIVTTSQTVRFEGKLLEQMPPSNSIRKSVESVLEQQRRFPLDTANNLRGRLRRMNFSVYKKGSKGVSYVCAVRRQFRAPGQQFAESVQQLIDFIEVHPNFMASNLPKDYLGMEIPEGGEQELPQETQNQLKQLRNDLRWLITSGYVTEYSDGRLFAPPARMDGSSGEDDDSGPAEPAKQEAQPSAAAPEQADGATQEPTPPTPETEPAQQEAEQAGQKASGELAESPETAEPSDVRKEEEGKRPETDELPQVHSSDAADKNLPPSKAVSAQNGEIEPIPGQPAPDTAEKGAQAEHSPEVENTEERSPNDSSDGKDPDYPSPNKV